MSRQNTTLTEKELLYESREVYRLCRARDSQYHVAFPTMSTGDESLLRIYDKLGVSNRVEPVLYALSHWQSRPPESVEAEQAV